MDRVDRQPTGATGGLNPRMETLRDTVSRTLTDADTKQNIPFTFFVPKNTTELRISLSFSPWKVDNHRNMLTLTIFDPYGWRGAGPRQGARHEVILSRTFATPGYLAGEILAGEWTVFVDTHMIMPGVPVPLEIEIVGTDEADVARPRSATEFPRSLHHGQGHQR